MVASPISAPLAIFPSISFPPQRKSTGSRVFALPSPYGDPSKLGLSGRTYGSWPKIAEKDIHDTNLSHGAIEPRMEGPLILPAVMTAAGPLDIMSVLFRNRIIFIGRPITALVAEYVVSQLMTLAAIDENADIMIYLNSPGGNFYSVLAIYDCMSWIKPKVGTICFGMAASQAVLILAGGEKGMRYSMPNSRIMIHQPMMAFGGDPEDAKRQLKEHAYAGQKSNRMYAAFTGQPLEKVEEFTALDHFFSAPEALDFGLIDGILETEL